MVHIIIPIISGDDGAHIVCGSLGQYNLLTLLLIIILVRLNSYIDTCIYIQILSTDLVTYTDMVLTKQNKIPLTMIK